MAARFRATWTTLLLNLQSGMNQSQAARAISNATWIGPNMGYGELDVYRSLYAKYYWGC